jgi:hypothetical protein
MTFEQTASLGSTHGLSIRAPAAMSVAGDGSGSRVRRLLTGAHQIRIATVAVLHALAAYGSPSFFELERRGPEYRRLGPGLSRVSDSFWPLTDW